MHMADGAARVSNGKPAGVFAMQYGPGAENAFAGIASAYSDSTPVLLLPLGHPRETRRCSRCSTRPRTYASVVKHVEPVVLPEHTVPAMRRAFNALKNGRPAGDDRGAGRRDDGRVRRQRGRLHGDPPDPLSRRPARHRPTPRKCCSPPSRRSSFAGQGVLYAEASDELVALADLLDLP